MRNEKALHLEYLLSENHVREPEEASWKMDVGC